MNTKATPLPSNKKPIFPIVFVTFFGICILLIGGLIAVKMLKKVPPQKSSAAKKTVVNETLVRRSKAPIIITKATTAKMIDINTGKIIKAARVFSPNDKFIYLILELADSKKGTRIDYIRYFKGRYVDHGGINIAKTGIKNIDFNWTNTKHLGNIAGGTWKVAAYANGILAKRIIYEVTNNKVSYVYPDKQVLHDDPESSFSKSLLAHVQP